MIYREAIEMDKFPAEIRVGQLMNCQDWLRVSPAKLAPHALTRVSRQVRLETMRLSYSIQDYLYPSTTLQKQYSMRRLIDHVRECDHVHLLPRLTVLCTHDDYAMPRLSSGAEVLTTVMKLLEIVPEHRLDFLVVQLPHGHILKRGSYTEIFSSSSSYEWPLSELTGCDYPHPGQFVEEFQTWVKDPKAAEQGP
jgi:hypothetical protein